MKKVGWSLLLVAAVLLTVAVTVEAQQPIKTPRIAYLGGVSFAGSLARIEAWRGKTFSLSIDMRREN
jgi:hypothetical protein